MNGVQITNSLLSDPIVRKTFIGVFAADRLPEKEYPGGYIVNTDTSGKPGQHWVAFYTEVPGKLEGFDSFGRNPSQYSKLIKRWIGKDFLTMCDTQHQSNDSTVCGQYCIFFILLRSHGFKYEDVTSALIRNREINDKFVCKFVNKYFKLRTTIKDEKFIINSLLRLPK